MIGFEVEKLHLMARIERFKAVDEVDRPERTIYDQLDSLRQADTIANVQIEEIKTDEQEL